MPSGGPGLCIVQGPFDLALAEEKRDMGVKVSVRLDGLPFRGAEHSVRVSALGAGNGAVILKELQGTERDCKTCRSHSTPSQVP